MEDFDAITARDDAAAPEDAETGSLWIPFLFFLVVGLWLECAPHHNITALSPFHQLLGGYFCIMTHARTTNSSNNSH
jgi:hypothetical protein